MNEHEWPSFGDRRLRQSDMDAMTPFQRTALKILCDDCNWTSCFVHVSEHPDGFVFQILTRGRGEVIERVEMQGKNRY